MILEIHDRLGHPQRIQCTRVLVREAAHGNPVAVVLEHDPSHLWISHSGEETFQRALKLMGITETVMNFEIDETPDAKTGLVLPNP